MLTQLSAQTHHVLTAVSIFRQADDTKEGYQLHQFYEVKKAARMHHGNDLSLTLMHTSQRLQDTEVTFAALPAAVIDAYIATGEPM